MRIEYVGPTKSSNWMKKYNIKKFIKICEHERGLRWVRVQGNIMKYVQ